MAIQLNLQGIVDARVARMLRSDKEVEAEAAVFTDLIGEFSDNAGNRIMDYTAKIKELKNQPDGAEIHKAAISFFEKRIAVLAG